jgi:hypothetical protein
MALDRDVTNSRLHAMRRPALTCALIVIAVLVVPGGVAAASAAVFSVTGASDGLGACTGSSCPTLRSAVLAANAAGGTNTINVPAGSYKLTRTPSGPDDGTTGDLHITANVTIAGAGAGAGGTTLIGDGDRVFDISANAVTLSGLAVTGGGQQNAGGAVKDTGSSLTLAGDAFTSNTTTGFGGFGGAIFMQSPTDGTLIVTGSSFASNVATNSGGSGGGFGGAIAFEPNNNGTMTIANSTFDSNTAQSGTTSGGGFGGGVMFEPGNAGTATITGTTFSSNAAAGSSGQGGFGGGIMFQPGSAPSALDVTNSTFNGNSAGGASGFGGAIMFQPGAGSSATLTHLTIVGNSATNSGSAGGIDIEDSPATIRNSIISGNTVGSAVRNCAATSGGSLAPGGHNIELGTTCGFDINANPNLAALGANGGPTRTMALQAGSPAIDAAAPAFCPATDQRGFARPDQPATACDIGAFEFTVPTVPPPAPPPANITPPAVTGNPEPGSNLRCSTGTWTGSPTRYAFRWRRGTTTLAGAGAALYTVQILDEAQRLSCTVTASNAGGSASSTSMAVLVAVPGTLRCPKPSGRMYGLQLGPLALGFTRAYARHALRRFHVRKNDMDDFCLYAGWGIRVGYPSSKLLRALTAPDRRRVRGRIVLALTDNPFYGLDGIKPGLTLAAAKRKLHLGKKLHLGQNDWYFAPGKRANLVLKVRYGVIDELGLADRRLSTGRRAQLRLLLGYPGG